MPDLAGLRYRSDHSLDPARDVVTAFGCDNHHARGFARQNSSLLDEDSDPISFPSLEPNKSISLGVYPRTFDASEGLLIDQALDARDLIRKKNKTRVSRLKMSSGPKWHLIGASPFSSMAQLAKAGKDLSWKMVVEYGLRYIPIQDTHTSAQRTVVIEEIPSDFTLAEVLSWVRGGKVFSSSLMNTVPITGSKSALVTFMAAESATTFTQMISSKSKIKVPEGVSARVLETATYPISQELQRTIEGQQASRCLLIRARIEDALQAYWELERKLGNNQYISCIAEKKQRILSFPSIRLALWAYQELYHDPHFGPETVCFYDDPCARPTPEMASRDGQ